METLKRNKQLKKKQEEDKRKRNNVMLACLSISGLVLEIYYTTSAHLFFQLVEGIAKDPISFINVRKLAHQKIKKSWIFLIVNEEIRHVSMLKFGQLRK